MTPALHRRGSARRPLPVLRRTVPKFLGLSLALVWFITLACAVMFGAATGRDAAGSLAGARGELLAQLPGE